MRKCNYLEREYCERWQCQINNTCTPPHEEEIKMKRKAVNKRASARAFNNNTRTTAAINMRGAPMRGGIRL